MAAQAEIIKDSGERGFRANWVVVGIGIASIATAVTTGLGMYSIFGNVPIAAVMTTLAQMVLIATSWMIGKDIAKLATGRHAQIGAGRGLFANIVRYTILIAIFFLVFFICWFFSFRFYYTTMFSMGEDRLVAVQQPVTFTNTFLPKVKEQVEKAYKEVGGKIVKDPPVAPYIAALEALAKEAENPATRKKIAERETTTATEKVARRRTLEDELRGLATRIEGAKKTIDAIQATISATQTQIATLDGQMKPWIEQITAKETERNNALQNAAREEAEGRDGRPPGCGQVCNAEKAAAEKLRNEIENIKRRNIAAFEAQKKKAQETVDAARTKLIPQQRTLEDDERSAKAKQHEFDSLGQSISPDAGQEALVEQLLKQFKDRRADFTADPEPGKLDALADVCGRVRDPLVGMIDVVKDLDCRPTAVVAAVRDRPQRRAAESAFLSKCTIAATTEQVNGIVAATRESALKESLSASERQVALAQGLERTQREIVQPCIGLAVEAGADIAALQDEIRHHVNSKSLLQDSFSQTRNAAFDLFSAGASSAARLGAAIALAQDLFVLLLSILGDIGRREKQFEQRRDSGTVTVTNVDWSPRPEDPPPVTAAKLILRGCENDSGSSATLPRSFGDDLAPDIRDNVMQLLRQLQRLNMVRRKPMSGALELSHEAVVQIENIVLSDGAKAPARSAPTVGETDGSASPAPENAEAGRAPATAATVQASTVAERTSSGEAPPPHSESRGSLLDSARRSVAAYRRSNAPPPQPSSAKTAHPAPKAEPGRNREAAPQSALNALAARAARARANRDS